MIGERIKNLRTQHNMTLKQLGEAIDFNYSNLSKIERGLRKPNLELLERLSAYYRLPIGYFFDGEKANCIPGHFDWVDLSKKMREKNISLEELKAMIKTVEKLEG